LIFPFLRAFYDCLKRYFHNIEFDKEQFLLGFKEESLPRYLSIVKNLEKHGKTCFTGVQYFSKPFKLLFFMAIYCSIEDRYCKGMGVLFMKGRERM
jgi:hypothetical protein